jgi:hypothetical protein
MEEFLNSAWVQILAYVVVFLWVVLGGSRWWARWRKDTREQLDSTQDRKERFYLYLRDRLEEWAEGAVTNVYHNYFKAQKKAHKALEAQGKLEPEDFGHYFVAKRTALQSATELVKRIADRTEGVDVADHFSPEVIEAAIEKAIGRMKEAAGYTGESLGGEFMSLTPETLQEMFGKTLPTLAGAAHEEGAETKKEELPLDEKDVDEPESDAGV